MFLLIDLTCPEDEILLMSTSSICFPSSTAVRMNLTRVASRGGEVMVLMKRSTYTVLVTTIPGSVSCTRAGPRTGTRKPWWISSSSWLDTLTEATWRTALHNSRLVIISLRPGISWPSSGPSRCQQGLSASRYLGRAEYSPDSPVARIVQKLLLSEM